MAVVGFRNTRRATIDTLAATRSDKVYDKRAEVYVECLTVLAQSLEIRKAVLRELRGELPSPSSRELMDSFGERDWDRLDARLQAFGTAEAYAAVQEYNAASIVASRAVRAAREEPSEAAMTLATVETAAADVAGNNVIILLRRELIGDGLPLLGWVGPGISDDAARGGTGEV